MLLVFAIALAGGPAPAVSTTAALPSPGSWTVVSTFESSNCSAPNDTGGALTNQWLVSTNADGTYAVVVTGSTSFPALAGRSFPGRFNLVGLADNGALNDGNRIAIAAPGIPAELHTMMHVSFDLRADEGRWVGTRRAFLVDGPKPVGDKAFFAACVVEWSVVATPG